MFSTARCARYSSNVGSPCAQTAALRIARTSRTREIRNGVYIARIGRVGMTATETPSRRLRLSTLCLLFRPLRTASAAAASTCQAEGLGDGQPGIELMALAALAAADTIAAVSEPSTALASWVVALERVRTLSAAHESPCERSRVASESSCRASVRSRLATSAFDWTAPVWTWPTTSSTRPRASHTARPTEAVGSGLVTACLLELLHAESDRAIASVRMMTKSFLTTGVLPGEEQGKRSRIRGRRRAR